MRLPTLRTLSLLFFLLLAGRGVAEPFTAIQDGEKFTYKVSFAIFGNAGEITVEGAKVDTDGKDQMKITVETRSRGFVRGVYAFDNKAVAHIDRSSGRLLTVHESGKERDRDINTDFIIDYETRRATFTDYVRTERSRELVLPERSDPIDLISALVQTREWNLKPGDQREMVVQFARDIYEITIVAEAYEDVRTPLGRYKTLVLVPRMDKEPKGLFKRGGEIKVWITQDESRLPVKMQLKLGFGNATLLLTDYAPPASTGRAAAN